MSAHAELISWLSTHELEKYFQVLCDNDITTVQLVCSLHSEDLKELGVSLGDRKRFELAARPGRSYSDFERTVMEKYPYVIAYPFRRMLDEGDGRNRLELLAYTLLNTLKFTALVMASDYFQSSIRSVRLNELFRANLFQPSMGHWNGFIREAVSILEAEGIVWTFPELAADYNALETSPKAKKYLTETEYTDEDGLLKYREAKLTAIGSLINFRNRYLGHGMPLEKERYARLYKEQYAVLTDLILGLSCMSDLVMLRNDSRGSYIMQGESVVQREPDMTIPRDADIHLRDVRGRQIPLLPFYIVPGKYNAGDEGRASVFVYEQNTTQRMIFYSPESVKAEVSGLVLERLKLKLEEKERQSPFSPEEFTAERMQDRIKAQNHRMLDGLQKEMKVIKGVYQPRFDAELALMGWAGAASGLFFLAAEAGSGKTNLLAHLLARYGELDYPTILLRGNRMSKPTIEDELRHVFNLHKDVPLHSYTGLLGTQVRPLMILVDGGNEHTDPQCLLQSVIDMAREHPGGGLKIVLSWRVNDISRVPSAIIRNPDTLFPAANRSHPNLLAANAYVLLAMSLVETEGAWKAYRAEESKRFRPGFDFQELLLADRPLALELSNPLLLRICMELFHNKGLKGISKGFTNLWRKWWDAVGQQPRESEYLMQLVHFLALKEKAHCPLDELFDDAALSAAVNNLQVDSPHRQLVRKGVLSQYIQDGILQVGLTMEASFHYILSLDLTPENISRKVTESVFWEAPAKYRLWEGVHNENDDLVFRLIDEVSFPNHLTAFALAQYILLHGQMKALDRLLKTPTPHDWDVLARAVREIRELRPSDCRALVNGILERVIDGDYPVSTDILAEFLSEADKDLADRVFTNRVQSRLPQTSEGLKSLSDYHSTYGRNRQALETLQAAMAVTEDIEGKVSVQLRIGEQYNELGQFDSGLEEVEIAKDLLKDAFVSDAVLEADIGLSEARLYRSKALYPKAMKILKEVKEAYGKKWGYSMPGPCSRNLRFVGLWAA